MIDISIDEVVSSLAGAKNLNAALKNFLKKEGASSPSLASFAKEFRVVVSSGRAEAVRGFIDTHYTRRPVYFMGVARYAFPELVETVVSSIIERHADTFNATYEREEGGIKVTDKKTFAEIVGGVDSMIEEALKGSGLGGNNFMRHSILTGVFEPDVFTEVSKVLIKSA
jgi:hypothetical protein